MPITDLVFGKFGNGGYMFSKVLCLATVGYVQWLLSTLHVLPLRAWSCYIVILLFAVVNLLINRKTAAWQRYIHDFELQRTAVNQEALFMALLLFWTYLRMLRPDIEGLEKFMDFGFLNSILRSDWLPAPDIWLAGKNINYYYFGHYITAFITKITFIDSAVTYNLMMATLFALSFMLVFSTAEFLIEIYQKNCEEQQLSSRSKYARIFAGVIAGLAVCFAGNLHAMIFGVLFQQWNVSKTYWFPTATRFIGYNPEVLDDKTIHEFPLYSFVVSDLHAHVINLLFVITVIGLVVSLADDIIKVRKKSGFYSALPGEVQDVHHPVSFEARKDIHPAISVGLGFLLIILLIGLFPAINFWDFPIYIVFTGAILLFANLRTSGSSLKAMLVTIAQVIAVGAAAYVVTLPFQLSFDSMGVKINMVKANSQLYQLGILWGWQLFFAAALIYMMNRQYKLKYIANVEIRENTDIDMISADKKSNPNDSEPAPVVPLIVSKGKYTLRDFINKVNPADALTFIIFICAAGLFFIPEIIYVADIYPSHPRANTMFKLGFQAFILFGIGVGYTLTRLIFDVHKARILKSVLIVIGSALLAAALIYPFFAIGQWYNPFKVSGKSLNGIEYMLTDVKYYSGNNETNVPLTLKNDYALIRYINETVEGSPVLAEAYGDSYKLNGRISAYTGLPNILNWYNHELLWRNSDYDMLTDRLSDINTLYKTEDAVRIRRVISKYNVEYIVISEIERLVYPKLNEELLMSMGEVIFWGNDQYDTYLIRVKSR